MIRLADVDEMPEAPPEAVRMGLRPGQLAGLYAVFPPALGARDGGVEPFEAVVVDVAVPGVYLGEAPDGSLVEFDERNVAWAGPELEGIFDWVKRAFRGGVPLPPVPGLPAPPPPSRPPTLPALPPAPAPRPSPVKEAFLKLFAPGRLPAPPAEPGLPAAPPAEKPSIFEWFKRPTPPPGPPAIRPEPGVPAPVVERPSMFAPFVPGVPGALERVVEAVQSIVPAQVPGLPTEVPEMFKHVKPAPEEDFEAKQAQQLQLWSTLFPEAEPGRAVPLEEMFRPFTPDEVRQPEPEAPGVAPPPETMPPVPSDQLKILPLPPRRELLPTAEQLARGFVTRYEPIEDLWDLIRRARQDPAFQRAVAKGMAGEGPGARFEFETLGMCDGNPDPYEAFAAFLQIPWSEVVRRGRPVTRTDEEGNQYTRLTDLDAINAEIVFPASELVFQAFELLKPPDLQNGVVVVEWGGHATHSCQLIVAYAEGFPGTAGEVSDPAVFQPPEPEPPTPEGHTKLGDIIPPEAVAPVNEIVNAILREDMSRLEGMVTLGQILEPYAAEMEAKGMMPGYVAAYLAVTVGRQPMSPEQLQKEVEAMVEDYKKKAGRPRKRRG